MIFDDHHLLRVITHCSAWILISSLRGPSAGAHRAFKGWLECSTHLSTLHSSQECRGRMSRPGLEDIRFRMHDWMTKGRALFFFLFSFWTSSFWWPIYSSEMPALCDPKQSARSGEGNCVKSQTESIWSATTKVHSTFMMVRSHSHCSIYWASFCPGYCFSCPWAFKLHRTGAQKGIPVPLQVNQRKSTRI